MRSWRRSKGRTLRKTLVPPSLLLLSISIKALPLPTLCRVKTAVKEIRKKLLDSNPTVVYFTLCVLDSVMKNCASDVHSEVLSHEFLAVMKEIVTSPQVVWSSIPILPFSVSIHHLSILNVSILHVPIQGSKGVLAVDKALELIGEWNTAFGQQAGYKAIHDAFFDLEKEGFVIPEAKVASAAFIKKVRERGREGV